MNTTALKNMERIKKEVIRTKNEYEKTGKKLVKEHKLEEALEITDITRDLSTLETMLNTISETFTPILSKLEIEVKRGRPRIKRLIETEYENINHNNTEKKKRGRPRKITNNENSEEIVKVETEKPKRKYNKKKLSKVYNAPVKMTLLGNETKINKNWREVYINTIEEMIKRKPEIVDSFPSNNNMQGRTMTYFSFDETVPMISKCQLSNKMFLNLNLSSTAILNNCYRVLEQCGFSANDLRVEVENYTKNNKISRKNLNL